MCIFYVIFLIIFYKNDKFLFKYRNECVLKCEYIGNVIISVLNKKESEEEKSERKSVNFYLC